MKIFTKTLSLFCLLNFANIEQAFSQVPLIGPIQGPLVVCLPASAIINYSVSASNAPTSYSWSYTGSNSGIIINNPTASVTSISFLTPYTNSIYTLYCYAVNGSGSSSVVSFVVNVFETPSVTFSGAQTICQGSSTNISASPTTFQASSTTISYNWSPSTGLSSTNSATVTANPPVSTNYTVLLTNGSCTNTSYFNLIVNPLPSLTVAINPNVICKGENATLQLTGSSSSYSLNGTMCQSVVTVSPSASKTYTITGNDANGCKNSTTTSLTVNPCLGINEFSKQFSDIEMFPNPNNGNFKLRSVKNETVVITNETGQKIKVITIDPGSEVEVTGLSPGIYFLTGSGKTKKIVVTP